VRRGEKENKREIEAEGAYAKNEVEDYENDMEDEDDISTGVGTRIGEQNPPSAPYASETNMNG